MDDTKKGYNLSGNPALKILPEQLTAYPVNTDNQNEKIQPISVLGQAVQENTQPYSAQAFDLMSQSFSNDMKVGIAVYKIENNGTATVHHVVEGPGIKNICDFMNGNGNTIQTDVPIQGGPSLQNPYRNFPGDLNQSIKGVAQNLKKNKKGMFGNFQNWLKKKARFDVDQLSENALNQLRNNSFIERIDKIKDSPIIINNENNPDIMKIAEGFDVERDDVINIMDTLKRNRIKGGKSRTAKRRASTKHSSSSRRRSGKIKRKSRRLRRRRQRQTKHRS
jgi:hypothetical protein